MSRRLRAACAAIAVASLHGSATAAVDPCRGRSFRDVTAASGIDFVHRTGGRGEKHLPETMGAGAAWLDADGDGRLDLYLVQSGAYPPDGGAEAANELWRNLGGGRFENVTAESGEAGDRGYGQGVAAADVNGDGATDLYLSNVGPDALLLNDGRGRFRDATREAGLGADGWSSSAAFADGDGDGDLDLYVARYLEYDPGEALFCAHPVSGERQFCDPTTFRGAPDLYYENRGDGSFEEATGRAGLAETDGKGLGVLFTDLDGDGRPDLYVANDLTVNLLYRNRGDGTFEDVSLFSGAGLDRQGKTQAGMGLAVGDVDGDLDPDLMVTNFDAEMNTLYVNTGAMLFEDVAAPSGFGPPSFNLLGFGLNAGDFDLDGDLDAYVANGHIFEKPVRDSTTHEQPDLLLAGDGRGRFTAVACGEPFERRHVGRGSAAADWDDDGDLDLVVLTNGGRAELLRNDGPPGAWLGVRLVGRPPNTGAVGARVELVGADGARQVRWLLAGDSYQSTSDPRLLFGLGSHGAPPLAVEVVWPDATRARFDDLAPGAYWVLDQRDGSAVRAAAGSAGSSGSGALPLVAGGIVLAAALAAAAVAVVASRARRRKPA